MITTLIILLIIFQVKHFVADYPLQTKYMLGKFREDGWVKPLLAHVAVHAGITFVIVLGFIAITDPNKPHWRAICFGAALFDASCHFVMDRVKASPKMLGRFKPLTAETFHTATPEQIRSNVFFWWSLGVDQLFHGLTDTIIVWVVVSLL